MLFLMENKKEAGGTASLAIEKGLREGLGQREGLSLAIEAAELAGMAQ